MSNKKKLNNAVSNAVEKIGEKSFYWLDGFYDTPQVGAIQITPERWQELLDGQSSGKEIVTDENGYPQLVEHGYTIDEVRDMKLSEIRQYDKSDAVNQFYIEDSPGWFDKSTRVGLRNSIQIEKESGKDDTTIWIANTSFILPIEKALDMLRQIELYAIECNNVTQSHIATIMKLGTKEEVETFNFKEKYPERLSFAY